LTVLNLSYRVQEIREQTYYQKIISELNEKLGQEKFSEYWEDGKAMAA